MTVGIDELLSAELPCRLVYEGRARVKRALKAVTVVGWSDLNIGFLTEEGSKAAILADGNRMWILDLAINYTFAKPNTSKSSA